MTLAKTCHVSNMMQDLKSNLWAYCNHESFVNRDVSIYHCCIGKKLYHSLKVKVAMLNE